MTRFETRERPGLVPSAYIVRARTPTTWEYLTAEGRVSTDPAQAARFESEEEASNAAPADLGWTVWREGE